MIHSKIKTLIKKDDTKRIRKAVESAKGAYVTIGVHDDAGKYSTSNAPEVAEVALWNEFGTGTIPERSFLRSAIDGNEGKINEWREEAINNIVEGRWNTKKALEAIGLRIQILIQNRIKSNVPPPNADSTIAAKQRSGVAPKSGFNPEYSGRTSTLIDTGLLLRSITYKVHL